MNGSRFLLAAAHGRGFTLLEVLVAVAIIAVIAVTVGIGLAGLGGSRSLEREAERLVSRLQYACEFAALGGRAVGMRQDDGSYRFVVASETGWQPVTQPVLAAHQLAGAALVVRRDGRRVEPAVAASAELAAPALSCFPSGELTPFRAELGMQEVDTRYFITGHADGRIELQHVAPPS